MNNIIKKTNENIEGFMNKLSKFNITSHLTNDEIKEIQKDLYNIVEEAIFYIEIEQKNNLNKTRNYFNNI